jgi:hypothetical protein
MYSPRVVHVGMLVVGTLLAAGCGDRSAESTEATIAAIDATQLPGEEDDEVHLDAILLRVDDLPEGWKKSSVGTVEGSSCLDGLFGTDRPLDPQFAATETFSAGDIGPFLSAWVVDEPVDYALVEVNDVLVGCDGTKTQSGFTTTIDPTPVPGLPDNSLSVHGADVNASGSRIDYTVAAAGSDRVTVVIFAATPLGEIDDAVISSAVNAMVGRIPPR